MACVLLYFMRAARPTCKCRNATSRRPDLFWTAVTREREPNRYLVGNHRNQQC
jgi:hypothetical protein